MNLSSLFLRRLDVREGEHPIAIALATLLATMTVALVVARTGCDALFLAALPIGWLPWLQVAGALGGTIAGASVVFLRGRIPQEIFFPVMATLAGSALIAFRIALDEGAPPEALAGLRVGIDFLGAGALAHIWTFAQDHYSDREDTRRLGVLELAATGAFALAGLVAWLASGVIAPQNLLILGAIVLWLTVAPALWIIVKARGKPAPIRIDAVVPGPSGVRAIATTPLLRAMLVLVALGAFATTVADFHVRALLVAKFGQEATPLAHWLGLLAAASSIVAVLGVLLSTSFGRQFGVVAPLAGAVLLVLGGAAWGVTGGGLAAAMIVAVAPGSVRFSVLDPPVQAVLAPVGRRTREEAGAVLERLVRPLGVALGAFAIHAAPVQPTTAIAWAALLAMLVVYKVRLEHVRSLGFSRGAVVRRAAFAELASAVPSALANERTAENALELLDHVKKDVSDLVAKHEGHASPRARENAITYLGKKGKPDVHAPIVRARMSDEDPDVRAAAIRAFCALKKADAVTDTLPFLDDADPAIQAAAVVGLLLHGGADGELPAASTLTRLLAAEDAPSREQAARALGLLPGRTTTSLIETLMYDPDARVRRAAIEAAGELRSPEFLPVLVERLTQDPRTTERALASYGVATLVELLETHAESREVLTHIVRALGRIGSPEAVRVLVELLYGQGDETRGAIAQALARAARSGVAVLDRSRLAGGCLVEIAGAYNALAALEALGVKDPHELPSNEKPPPRPVDIQARDASPPGAETARTLMEWALREKLEGALERAFGLLAALYPDTIVVEGDAARRAALVFALGNLLDARIRESLVPLIDPRAEAAPRKVRLASARGVLVPQEKSAEAWLKELLADESTWVVTCAANWAGVFGVKALVPTVLSLLERPSPIVREAALGALEQLLPTEDLPRAVSRLLWDPFPAIKRRVDRILERIVDKVELDRAHGEIEEVYAS